MAVGLPGDPVRCLAVVANFSWAMAAAVFEPDRSLEARTLFAGRPKCPLALCSLAVLEQVPP